MTQADSVLSTPPTDTPVDTTRRRFLTVAAVGSIAGAGSLAFAAAAPNDVPKAVTVPRHGKPDPAFALIADKRAADIAHGEAIDAQDEADDRYGFHSDESSEADGRCLVACRAVNAIDWRLATTSPTTLAGVAAVLRFANEIEDGGMEWPNTGTVGRGLALPVTGDHGGGDRGLDQGAGRKGGAVMKRPMTLQRRKFLSAAAGADAVRGRMCVFLNEKKATEAEITRWLKGKITTSRIHDFAAEAETKNRTFMQ